MKKGIVVFLFGLVLVQNCFAALKGKPVKTKDGCVVALEANGKVPGVELLLVEEKIDDPLESEMVNGPRRISREVYDRIPSKDRAIKVSEARKLADLIADQILSPEVLESDDRMIRIHNILSTRLGVFPRQIFDSLNRLLGVDLGALRVANGLDPKTGAATFNHLRFDEKTTNHIVEVERIMTDYRKNGLTLTGAANLLSRLPMGKGAGQRLLEKFQTALSAIEIVMDKFDEDIGEFYKLHEEMRQARLATQALDQYEQIAAVVADQIHQRFQEWIEHSGASPEEIEAFIEDAVSPLAQRQQMITGIRSTAVMGYTMLRLLMANNQRLIVIYGNLRDLADVKLRLSGGGKIMINKQIAAIDRAEATYNAMIALDEHTVAQLKSLGRRILDFPALIVGPHIERAVDLVQELVDEVQSVREGDVAMVNNLVNGARKLNARLDELGRRGGLDNFIVEADAIARELGAPANVDAVPAARNGSN